MTSTITATSSAALVAEDLITDRSIALKIFFCVLSVAQLFVSWILAILFTVSFIRYSRLMEMILTWIILFLGNYIITGIANGVVYWRRWNKAAILKRRKSVEENKDAWMLLRLFLTLLGIAPVGRYIETIATIRRMLALEKEYMPQAVEQERQQHQAGTSIISGGMSEADGRASGVGPGGSRPVSSGGLLSTSAKIRRGNNQAPGAQGGGGGGGTGSRPNSVYELKQLYRKPSTESLDVSVVEGQDSRRSTLTRPRSGGGITEKAYRKIRAARRHMRRCENDAAQVVLLSGFFAGAPMAVAQFFILLRRDAELMQESTVLEYIFIVITLIFSLLWAAATLVHYYPGRRMISEAEFERGLGMSRGGIALLFLTRIGFIGARCLALGAFASFFTFWVFLVLALHWIYCFVVFLVYRCVSRGALTEGELGDSTSQRGFSGASGRISVVDYLLYAWVGLFDFINGNEGKTRLRYIIFYVVMLLENIGLVVAWFCVMPLSAAWYRLPILLVVVILPGIAFIVLQVYYFYFHSNKGSVSLCGICREYGEDRHRQMYQNQQVRDSLFGVPVAQSVVPFYHNPKSKNGSTHSLSGGGAAAKAPGPTPSKAPSTAASMKPYHHVDQDIHMDSVSQVGAPTRESQPPRHALPPPPGKKTASPPELTLHATVAPPGQQARRPPVPGYPPGPHPHQERMSSNTTTPVSKSSTAVSSQRPLLVHPGASRRKNSSDSSSSEEAAVFVPRGAGAAPPPSKPMPAPMSSAPAPRPPPASNPNRISRPPVPPGGNKATGGGSFI